MEALVKLIDGWLEDQKSSSVARLVVSEMRGSQQVKIGKTGLGFRSGGRLGGIEDLSPVQKG